MRERERLPFSRLTIGFELSASGGPILDVQTVLCENDQEFDVPYMLIPNRFFVHLDLS